MNKSYLTEYTESIDEFSASFEYIIANAKIRSKANEKGFYSSGHGIISEKFYIGNNLTEGLISIEIDNSDSYIFTIPKKGKYKACVSGESRNKFTNKQGGIVLPSKHITYTASSDVIDDLIVIIDKKKIDKILKRNYNLNIDKNSPSFIRLKKKNDKVASVIHFIESSLNSAKNFNDLRDSLLMKSNIEEISALYISDLIAEAFNADLIKKNASPDLDLVLKVEELIQESPNTYFTILDIADNAFSSARNIQIAFKKHRNYSPMQFLKEQKFHMARKLILKSYSKLSLKTIAINSGITDVNRFGSYYKKIFGESPSQTALKNYASKS